MPQKVLIVEDDPEMSQLLGLQFQSKDYAVSAAGSGNKAVDILQRERFDLVVCDVVMPGVDGLEVLREAKRLDPNVEVILITVYGLELAAAAIKAGAFDLVQKPFKAERILSMAERALDKGELKTLLAIQQACAAALTSEKGDELLPQIVTMSMKVLGADDVSIMTADEEGRLKVAATSGPQEDRRRQAMLPMGERVAGRVAVWKEPVIINGPVEKDRRFSGLSSFRDIRSSIVYPLTVKEELLGVLCANRVGPGEVFSARDLRVAGIFGSQIAHALRYTRLNDRLEAIRTELQTAQRILQGILRPPAGGGGGA